MLNKQKKQLDFGRRTRSRGKWTLTCPGRKDNKETFHDDWGGEKKASSKSLWKDWARLLTDVFQRGKERRWIFQKVAFRRLESSSRETRLRREEARKGKPLFSRRIWYSSKKRPLKSSKFITKKRTRKAGDLFLKLKGKKEKKTPQNRKTDRLRGRMSLTEMAEGGRRKKDRSCWESAREK